MTDLVPTKVFFIKGKGVHREKLASFELALRDAGIAHFNIVEVSSILPPDCEIITSTKGLRMLRPGQIVYMVLSQNSSREAGRLISAAIGCAIPQDRGRYGYISEYHGFGVRASEAGEYAEDLAAEMLASTLGIPFDADASYDEKREAFRFGGRIVRTRHVVQTARCASNDKWTTVVAAAVFVME